MNEFLQSALVALNLASPASMPVYYPMEFCEFALRDSDPKSDATKMAGGICFMTETNFETKLAKTWDEYPKERRAFCIAKGREEFAAQGKPLMGSYIRLTNCLREKSQ